MPEMEKGKPVVEYPCLWGYKVIGPDEEAMRMKIRGTGNSNWANPAPVLAESTSV